MTKNEQKVLDFITHYHTVTGNHPTYREIAIHLNNKSVQSAFQYVEQLIKLKELKKVKNGYCLPKFKELTPTQ